MTKNTASGTTKRAIGKPKVSGASSTPSVQQHGGETEKKMQPVTHPRQPAGDKMIALRQRQAGAAKECLTMGAQNLHRALRPASALALIGSKIGRHQTAAQDFINVNQTQALLHQTQAEFAVFANTGRLPALDRAQGAGPDHGHRAMLDRCIALLTVVHADAEKAVVLPVHHAAERALRPIAMRLR